MISKRNQHVDWRMGLVNAVEPPTCLACFLLKKWELQAVHLHAKRRSSAEIACVGKPGISIVMSFPLQGLTRTQYKTQATVGLHAAESLPEPYKFQLLEIMNDMAVVGKGWLQETKHRSVAEQWPPCNILFCLYQGGAQDSSNTP